MPLRTRYGIGILGVLCVIMIAYLRLTLLKVDAPQNPARAEGINARSKSAESAAGLRVDMNEI